MHRAIVGKRKAKLRNRPPQLADSATGGTPAASCREARVEVRAENGPQARAAPRGLAPPAILGRRAQRHPRSGGGGPGAGDGGAAVQLSQ